MGISVYGCVKERQVLIAVMESDARHSPHGL